MEVLMNMDAINIGDILLDKTNAGDDVLIVTGKSLDVTKYGSCYITVEIITSRLYERGKEFHITTLGLLRGVEKIA
jgi:hypothetical protein